MKVGMVYGGGPHRTGVMRYGDEMTREVRALGIDAEPMIVERREWRVFGRPVGGVVSSVLGGVLARPKPDWDLVHVLDPAVIVQGTDVVTVHDLLPETHPELIRPTAPERVAWALLRRGVKRTPWVTTNSADTRRTAIARWGLDPDRVRVVSSGVDVEKFWPRTETSELMASDRVNLAYVGDDHPRKNLGLIIEAMKLLRARGVETRFVRVGPTRFAHAWRDEAVRAGLDVVEPGWIDDEASARVLSACDVFVWPTLAEGFGAPPLEAMACGARVVALDTGINRETCGEAATYHRNDAADAARVIAEAVASTRVAERQRAYAKRFTWAASARVLVGIYEEALAARGKKR